MAALVTSVVFILACDVDVPIREMSEAKSTITRATEVKAEKYAPEDLKTAKDKLMGSHALVMDKEAKKAKAEAELSLKAGRDAVEKSLPPLAKDELDGVKKVYAEAEQLDAERSAPEEFSRASAMIKESDSLAGEKKFWESYQKAKEAAVPAGEARDKALASVPVLEKAIESLAAEADKLKKNRGDEFAAEDIAATLSHLNDAKTNIQSKSLKEAHAKVKDSESLLASAKDKTNQGVAVEKLDAADKSLKKLGESDLKEPFSADIDKAAGLVARGREDLTTKQYEASLQKADEAAALIASIGASVDKKREETKAADEKGVQAELDKKKVEPEKKPGEADKTPDKKIDVQTGVQATEYVVVYNPASRDCLWKIAQNAYQDPMLWPLIYQANKDQIKDPDLIFPGQKFIIPSIPKKVEPGKEEPKKEEAKKEEPKADASKTAEPAKEETKKATDKPNEEKTEIKDKKVE